LQSCGLASRSNKELTCENRNFLELLSLSFCLLSFFHPFSLSPHQPFNFKIISLIASSIPSASYPHSLYNSSCVPCSTK